MSASVVGHAMAKQAHDDGGAARPGLVWLWCAFFAYTATLALSVQLLLLPYVFPQWHAGNGLLVGGDWLWFHELAVNLARGIARHGWGVWELRPRGQAPAGIAAAIYTLTWPEPWTLIPLNAALHATAAVVLMQTLLVFTKNWRIALLATAPFLVFPTAMTWYAQIHKDGYSVAGVLLFLYGWLLLAGVETWREGRRTPLVALGLILAGGALAWVVRPYLVEVMLSVGALMATLVSAVWARRALRGELDWRRAATATVAGWVVLAVLVPLAQGGPELVPPTQGGPGTQTGSGASAPDVVWRATPWLPAAVDSLACRLAASRQSYFTQYPEAASNVYEDVHLSSASDVVAFVPNAAWAGFLAPFPSQALAAGRLAATTAMRRVVGLEMLIAYFLLPFVLYAAWVWRRRIEVWLVLVFCVTMILVHALTVPNVGALCRFRYPYLMTLVGLGIIGLVQWRGSIAGRRSGSSDSSVTGAA